LGTLAYTFDRLGGAQAGDPATLIATIVIAGFNTKTWYMVTAVGALSAAFVCLRRKAFWGFGVLCVASVFVSFYSRSILLNTVCR
jgi:hypothetical protein